jgi:hypothetical protein
MLNELVYLSVLLTPTVALMNQFNNGSQTGNTAAISLSPLSYHSSACALALLLKRCCLGNSHSPL